MYSLNKAYTYMSNIETANVNKEVRQSGDGIDGITTVTWCHAFNQIWACCVAHSLVIQAGINMAFSAVLLPQLDANKNDIEISEADASWIASLVTLSLPVGALLVGPLMDKFGRKTMCLAATMPAITASLLHANATKVWHIFLARITAGVSGGLSLVALVYVSEITHPDYRPMLLSLNSVFVSFGILFTYVVGLLVPWRMMSMINCSIVVLTLIFLWFIPESPHWLFIFKNDPRNAAKALQWIYPNNEVFENQYQYLRESNEQRTSQYENNDGEETSRLLRIKMDLNMYCKPVIYKPVLILLLLFLFQQLSGAYAIIFYAVDIFKQIGGHVETGNEEFVALVLLGSIRFVMAIVSALISKRIGRRPLLIVSGIGMCFTSLVATLYMYLIAVPANESAKIHDVNTATGNDNLILVCILVYVCLSSIGYLVVPWTLIGELLPVTVRGKLGGLLISSAYLLMFVVVKAFPHLLAITRLSGLFCIFFIVNLCAVCFTFFFLPETLGKSFSEIEKYFQLGNWCVIPVSQLVRITYNIKEK